MADRQLKHKEIVNLPKKHHIVVICDNLHSAENIGMIFRQCEAMAVEKLILGGRTPKPESEKSIRAARSAIDKVRFEVKASVVEYLKELKLEGYKILGLEVTDNSKPIRTINFNLWKKIALVIGSERFGISEEALQEIEMNIHIPMYGINTSINVVQALAIALYEITGQISSPVR